MFRARCPDTRVGRDMDTELGDLLEDGMPTPEQRLTREKLHDDLLGLLNELSGREARVIGCVRTTTTRLNPGGDWQNLDLRGGAPNRIAGAELCTRAPRPRPRLHGRPRLALPSPAIPPHSPCSRHAPRPPSTSASPPPTPRDCRSLGRLLADLRALSRTGYWNVTGPMFTSLHRCSWSSTPSCGRPR